jgi:hypothetical protein
MNKELIQKLFSKSCWDEQAEVDIEDWCDVEKFAELIVRECMLQCDTPASGNTPLSKDFNEGHFMGVYESFHKIRNHFGVKEE